MLTLTLLVVIILLVLAVLRRPAPRASIEVRSPGYTPSDAQAVRPTLQDHPYVVEQRARMAAARKAAR